MGRAIKPAHYRGGYHVNSAKVRAQANADPLTRCWRCGRLLPEHQPHRNGKPARWTAGHLRDSDPTSPLLPEASTCNLKAGATYGNRLRGARRDTQNTPEHTSWRW